MPTGTGRGDGDEGSPINYHIGYLNVKGKSNGKSDVKPYIRTGLIGKRVKPKGNDVKFKLHRYFLIRATDQVNKDLLLAEDKLAKWKKKAGEYGPYIKIAEIDENDGTDQGDYNCLP